MPRKKPKKASENSPEENRKAWECFDPPEWFEDFLEQYGPKEIVSYMTAGNRRMSNGMPFPQFDAGFELKKHYNGLEPQIFLYEFINMANSLGWMVFEGAGYQKSRVASW